MTYKYKYFIANWKMFGDFSSLRIINSINNYVSKIKLKKNRIIFCVPTTLISHFSNKLKKSKIFIGAQNCHYLDKYGPHTGSINSKMIKSAGAKYVILGHSENRIKEHYKGDTDDLINKKIKSAIKNNLVVIFCIGENKNEKKKKMTIKVLKRQLKSAIEKKYNLRKIVIAYEPVWSIGTGRVPSSHELRKNIITIKKFIKQHLNTRYEPKILYGGSVDKKSVYNFKSIKELDGFLIGGASKSSKKFIDIIKNYYK